MADDNDVLERLDSYAKGIAHRILLNFELAHDRHRAEDIAQELLIAGADVWREKRNEEFAKHRMSSRGVNETERLARELRQPQPLASLADAGADGSEGPCPDVTDTKGVRWITDCPASRASPIEDMLVREYLDGLPERQRRILQHRLAGMEFGEIAEALGTSLSTVEREMAALKKGYRDEQGN